MTSSPDPSQQTSWYKQPITVFTAMLAVFSAMLAISTGVNVWAFMESEGAELAIEDVGFARGEPSTEPDGLDVILLVRNFGKHIAAVALFNISPAVFIVEKELPATPRYHAGSITPVVPPISPGRAIFVYGKLDKGQAFSIAREDVIKGALNGSIPVRIYGFVRYYTGYSIFAPAELGYCFRYIPPNQRRDAKFEVCDDPRYTYTLAVSGFSAT